MLMPARPKSPCLLYAGYSIQERRDVQDQNLTEISMRTSTALKRLRIMILTLSMMRRKVLLTKNLKKTMKRPKIKKIKSYFLEMFTQRNEHK